MANFQLPQIVQRVLSVMSTDDDASTLDTVLSVGTLVFAAGILTPLVVHLLPIVPAVVATPLTAGALAVVVNRLS